MNSVGIRWPFLLTFWSGLSEVSIYAPVAWRPYPALAGMMADEPSRPLLALAAQIALTTGKPRVVECFEDKRLQSSCFSAQW